jgi:ubiquinone/menaquinone biosynthesis C-methylase UbiE
MTRDFYTEKYESELLRGVEDPRPWYLHDEVAEALSPDSYLLDVGCGTAIKTVKLSYLARQTIGIEPNGRMRQRASENIQASKAGKLTIVGGLGEALPFNDASFDVATASLAPCNAKELSRVLKPTGSAIIENIGERDKHDLKLEFGSDGESLRGRYTSWTEGGRSRYFEEEYSPWFSQVIIREGFWPTYYSREGLTLMLEQTPAVRGFDRAKDAQVLDRIEQLYTTDRGIRILQHRLLIHARKSGLLS